MPRYSILLLLIVIGFTSCKQSATDPDPKKIEGEVGPLTLQRAEEFDNRPIQSGHVSSDWK